MNAVDGIQKAVDFVEDNLYEELEQEMIASQAGLSSFHFQRLFSAVCGMTLGEYIRNRRLTLAGIDVETTREKIIDIALKYHYESPESFSRAFTRFHGLSPMAARSHKGHLNSFAKISVKSILGGSVMQKLKERGYTVKENAPVYYTQDMDKTAEWFDKVLGWYAGIDQRNEKGEGIYGCIMPLPDVVSSMSLMPFNGFHMFYGEPSDQMVAFMRVDNLRRLCDYAKSKGWDGIGEIKIQRWGGEVCDIKTVDGSIIRFFQLD